MLAEFCASSFQAQHEVQALVYSRKVMYPDVFEDPHDGELAELVYERVITCKGEIDFHVSL
jgi:hypothetical protein